METKTPVTLRWVTDVLKPLNLRRLRRLHRFHAPRMTKRTILFPYQNYQYQNNVQGQDAVQSGQHIHEASAALTAAIL